MGAWNKNHYITCGSAIHFIPKLRGLETKKLCMSSARTHIRERRDWAMVPGMGKLEGVACHEKAGFIIILAERKGE